MIHCGHAAYTPCNSLSALAWKTHTRFSSYITKNSMFQVFLWRTIVWIVSKDCSILLIIRLAISCNKFNRTAWALAWLKWRDANIKIKFPKNSPNSIEHEYFQANRKYLSFFNFCFLHLRLVFNSRATLKVIKVINKLFKDDFSFHFESRS